MQKKRFLNRTIFVLFLVGLFFAQNVLSANIKARVAGAIRRAINYFDDSKVKVDKKLDQWQSKRAAVKKRFELPGDASLDESTKQLILTENGKDWFLYSKEAENWFADPNVMTWIKGDKELLKLYYKRYAGSAEPYLERVKTFLKNKFSSSKVKKSEKETGLLE